MRGGKNKKQPLGYTVIEVMIVLAVSSLMFLIASQFVSGKQERTSFTEGVNETATNINKLIEEVTDGQYSDIPLSCQYNGTDTLNISSSAGPTQGINAPCVFLGKLFHFRVGNNKTQYEVISVAGARVNLGGQPIYNIANASPTVVPDLTIKGTIPQNLQVECVTEGASHNYVFGFMQGLGAKDTVNGGYVSGAQVLSMWTANYPYNAGPFTTNVGIAGSLNQAAEADVYVTDGLRHAKIVVGSSTSSSQLSVTVNNLPNGNYACP